MLIKPIFDGINKMDTFRLAKPSARKEGRRKGYRVICLAGCSKGRGNNSDHLGAFSRTSHHTSQEQKASRSSAFQVDHAYLSAASCGCFGRCLSEPRASRNCTASGPPAEPVPLASAARSLTTRGRMPSDATRTAQVHYEDRLTPPSALRRRWAACSKSVTARSQTAQTGPYSFRTANHDPAHRSTSLTGHACPHAGLAVVAQYPRTRVRGRGCWRMLTSILGRRAVPAFRAARAPTTP